MCGRYLGVPGRLLMFLGGSWEVPWSSGVPRRALGVPGGPWGFPGKSLGVLGAPSVDRRRLWGSVFLPSTALSCSTTEIIDFCDLPEGYDHH